MKTNKRLHIRLAKREEVSEFARFIGISRWGLYKVLKKENRNLWMDYIRLLNSKEIYMLGQKVYYLELGQGNPNVYEGVVVGSTISHTGYRLYLIQKEDGKVAREAAYVFADKEAAKEAFERMLPRAKEMYVIQEKAQEECDKIRLELLGEPEFPHLVKE